jgi:hypothetical protein
MLPWYPRILIEPWLPPIWPAAATTPAGQDFEAGSQAAGAEVHEAALRE